MQTPAASAPHDLLTPLDTLENNGEFIDRHIGPDAEQIQQMLSALNLDSLEGLVDETVPAAIALQEPMALGTAMTEPQALAALRSLADKNELRKSFIGLGYYDTHTPNVILRNVLENPSWYTAYTPYQPEISQGRLESLLNYQQMVLDLTGMDLANASLLDEATAAAEAMALAKRVSKNRKANAFFVDAQCFPQTIDVIKTRAECFGFELIVAEPSEIGASIDPATLFGGLFQYPAMNGELRDLSGFIATLHEHSAIAIAAADILSLTLLTPPGEMGADVVVGTTQRFGVPMGYGGPHAAYFATKDDYKRAVPGRIIGVSVDKRGRQAFRMALQTREQHIRREKANSNICTAQVLLANISAMYAMYHGPEGLRGIAQRVNRLAQIFSQGLKSERIEVVNTYLFDTVTVAVSGEQASGIVARADAAGINLRLDRLESDGEIGVSFDECTTAADVDTLWQVFVGDMAKEELSVAAIDAAIVAGKLELSIPDSLQRQSSYLTDRKSVV